MARRDRSDQTVGAHEKKHDLPPGTIRNPEGLSRTQVKHELTHG
ncbi:hypothetical protein C8R14_1354 [Nitrosomonas eutropha]|uniref:Uncharacterized protein n=1 Tax=Nitrosomonas eutropha TaxID=916 RepID=A0ABX5M544_9PROT|nr:hypothetical protein C8R14_1354 [Nitrosomonas eutropha]